MSALTGLIQPSRDYLTILVVRYPRDALMTKRLFRGSDGAVRKADYDNAAIFDAQVERINSLGDLALVLVNLSNRTDRFVIRGKLGDSHHNVRRRIHGSEAAFSADPEGHHWVFCDFDEVPLPLFLDPLDDAEIVTGYLVRQLPRPFWTCSYFWQWSCGQGLDGGKSLRCHIWFWSSKKHTDGEMENWAKWVNGEAGWKVLDASVFRTVQPNYTSAPVIDEGVADPIPQWSRCGVYIGEQDEVSFTIPAKSWDEHVRQQARADDQELAELGLGHQPGTWSHIDRVPVGLRYEEYLRRIGDDKDGFHEPILKAIWHWTATAPETLDEDFKEILRRIVRSALCDKQRDLNHYLSDYRLGASLKGAREKRQAQAAVVTSATPHLAALASQTTTLAKFQQVMRRYSFTRIDP